MSLNTPSPRNARRAFRGVNPGYTSPVGVPRAPDRRSRAFSPSNTYRPTNIPPARGQLPPAPARGPSYFRTPYARFLGAALQIGETYLVGGGNDDTFGGKLTHMGGTLYRWLPRGEKGHTVYSAASSPDPRIDGYRPSSYVGTVLEFNMPVSGMFAYTVLWENLEWQGVYSQGNELVYNTGKVVIPPGQVLSDVLDARTRVLVPNIGRPIPYHRPAAIPVAGAGVPKNPLIRPGLGFEFTPGAPPRVIKVPTSRPPPRTQEGKASGSAAVALGMVVDAFNTATEVADVLAIFWDNLPVQERTFWDTMVRMMENPSLWDQVDWDQMVLDLIANEVEDQAIGRLHGLKRRLRTEWGEPTYGGAFQGP